MPELYHTPGLIPTLETIFWRRKTPRIAARITLDPWFHQKLDGTESQRTPFSKLLLLELLDTQVFSGGLWTVGPVGDVLGLIKLNAKMYANF